MFGYDRRKDNVVLNGNPMQKNEGLQALPCDLVRPKVEKVSRVNSDYLYFFLIMLPLTGVSVHSSQRYKH